ncbi:MAG: hypothetical protein ACYTCU_02165 [Planctomycetota bacterium]|jgi:hypothetical protein
MPNAQSKAMVPTVLAAVGIVAGLFGPLARVGGEVELLGEVSTQPTYFDFFATQSYVLIALSAVALVMALRGMKLIWICAIGVWVTLLWDIIRGATTPKDDSIGGQIKDLISNEVGKAVSEHAGVLFDITSLSWGGFALLGGALIMIWAGIKGR